jgi:hypothetical protein
MVDAIANDLENYAKGLRDLAEKYRNNHGDHSETAALVDATLDWIRRFVEASVWPRQTRSFVRPLARGMYRRMNVRTDNLIIICDRVDYARDEVRRLLRDPHDKRLTYISDANQMNRVRGLPRDTTAWTVLFGMENARDNRCALDQLQACYGNPVSPFSDAVSLINWKE